MTVLRVANLAVAFLLELAMLAAFIAWGLALDTNWPLRVAAAVISTALAAGYWGALLAPRSPRRLRMPWILVSKIVLYGLAAAALAHSGRPVLGTWLFALALASLALGVLWRQDEIITRPDRRAVANLSDGS